MAVTTPPIFLQSGSHSAKAFRQALAAIMGVPVQTFVSATGLTANGGHGVVGLGDLAVSQRGAGINMSVDVAAGYALIVGTSSLAQGVYAFANDAVVNVVISAAHATLGRRDLICAQVRDNTEDASGSNDARLMVVTGTPSGSPVDPTPPAGALVLARVTVAAAATTIANAAITDLRVYARTQNRLPRGKVAYAIRTSGQILGTGPTDLTGLSITYTAEANRLYKVTGRITVDQDANASANRIELRLLDGAGTQIAVTSWIQDNTGIDDQVMVSALVAPGAGAITYKLALFRAGLALVNTRSGAIDPSYIVAEDIGPVV